MLRLMLILLLFAPALPGAQTRTPEDAETIYREVGSQLFCICGCRENLLTCSMNVCSSKNTQRAFLRGLTQDASLDTAAIKERMAERFGPNVLQVPSRSSLYPMLGVGLALLAAVFGYGLWTVARRDPPDDADKLPPTSSDPVLEERIRRELKELD